MKLADVFLVIGEKCEELREANFAPYFHYNGSVSFFNFYVRPMPFIAGDARLLDIDSLDFESVGDWMQACLNASNLLMHK